MKNLLALAALALLAFTGLGWYLGWYSVATNPTPTGRHISIDLNTPKIKEDAGRAREKVRDILSGDDDKSPQTNVTPAGYQRPADDKQDFTPTPPSGNGTPLPPPR